MATYAVSFEIKADNEYDKRYASLVKQLKLKGTMWDETTSFCLGPDD